jgi:hypothetical protein
MESSMTNNLTNAILKHVEPSSVASHFTASSQSCWIGGSHSGSYACCLPHAVFFPSLLSTLMMEAICPSETSVSSRPNTMHYTPEERTPQQSISQSFHLGVECPLWTHDNILSLKSVCYSHNGSGASPLTRGRGLSIGRCPSHSQLYNIHIYLQWHILVYAKHKDISFKL